MRGLVLVAAAVVALAFAGAAPAASVTSLERAALSSLKRAPVSAGTKTSARSEIARAAHLIRTLPNGRSYHILVALQEVASFRNALTQPRALALYGALKANDDYFAKHWAPADSTDIVGADGVVYRYFGGYCFRFHPLANFGVLNARATSGDVEGTQELADALVARGVYQSGGGVGWEYDFPFSGGKAPWLSGMAQAVAAQAFSRAATTVPENASTYMTEATAAFRVIPKRLLTSVTAGPWIRLYAFSSLTVLNAQLQAVISLEAYASASGDAQAQTLASRMQNAAAASLSRFDTGYWSYYALPREPSPPDYHHFVVQLLTKLKTADPRFADAATRFSSYEKEPPAFQLANGAVGQVRFWLSKPATVAAVTSAGPTKRLALLGGWHTLTWQPKRAGVYPVHITATDWNGHTFAIDAPPIVRVGAGAFNAGEAVHRRRLGHGAARRREPRVAQLARRRDCPGSRGRREPGGIACAGPARARRPHPGNPGVRAVRGSARAAASEPHVPDGRPGADSSGGGAVRRNGHGGARRGARARPDDSGRHGGRRCGGAEADGRRARQGGRGRGRARVPRRANGRDGCMDCSRTSRR